MHRCVHSGKKKIACKECNKTFFKKSSLEKHLYVCKVRFAKKSDLKAHHTVHKEEKQFACDQCDKSFTNDSSLRRHHILVHEEKELLGSNKKSNLQANYSVQEEEKQFACNQCKKSFTNDSSLKRHHILAHKQETLLDSSKKSDLKANDLVRKEGKQFVCDQCYKRFTDHTSFKKHLILAHREGAVLDGNNSSTKFSQESDLEADKSVPKNENLYACSECDRCFSREISLSRHIRVHTREGRYICNICNAKFSRNFDLKIHYSVHEGNKKYPCKYCNRRFLKDSSLKKHIYIHFVCSICNTKFSEESDLKEHVLTAHGVEDFFLEQQDPETHNLVHADQDLNLQTQEPVQTEEPFVCSTCYSKFFEESELKAHPCIQIQKEEKDYVCNQCGRKFSKEDSLKKHVHVHTRAGTFVCKKCKIRFPQESNLKAHKCIYWGEHDKSSQDSNLKTPEEQVLNVCRFCGTIFPEESDLNAHLCINRVKEILSDKPDKNPTQDLNPKTNGLVDTEQAFICKTCNTRFSQESDLKAHHCLQEVKQFTCNQCYRTFAKDSSLKKHLHVHEEKPSFACSTCEIKFPLESDLKAHRCLYREEETTVEKHDKKPEDNNLETDNLTPAENVLFICSFCGIFSQESEWKAHNCVATEENFIPDKRSIQDFNLQAHNLAYVEELLFICDNCRIIIPESELASHRCGQEEVLIENHKNSFEDFNTQSHDLVHADEFLFICNTCKTLFPLESELKNHKCIGKREKGLGDQSSFQEFNLKSVQAHMCVDTREEIPNGTQDKNISEDPSLHIQPVEKPFICDICSKSFYDKATLRTHLRVHTREKSFICSVCKKNFMSDFALKVHLHSENGRNYFM